MSFAFLRNCNPQWQDTSLRVRGFQICVCCDQRKPVEDFYVHKPGLRKRKCKACYVAEQIVRNRSR